MLWKEIAKLELLSGSTRIALLEPNRFLNRKEPNRRGTDTTRTALRFFFTFLKPNEPKRTAGSLHMCLVFCFPRFRFCNAIWTGNGLDSRANIVLLLWRHEGLFIQRGAGGSIAYSFALYPLNVVVSLEHLATAHLKATHWILWFGGCTWKQLSRWHSNDLPFSIIFQVPAFSFIAFNFKWRAFQFIFLLVNGKHLHQPVWLISTWINSCFNLCQLMTAEFCPSNMRSKPFWYSIMLVSW